MYCTSWNFFAHTNFSWTATTFTNDAGGKEYYKCQTVKYKYKKLKVFRDLETFVDEIAVGSP